MAGGNGTAVFGMLEARESATEARWGSRRAHPDFKTWKKGGEESLGS